MALLLTVILFACHKNNDCEIARNQTLILRIPRTTAKRYCRKRFTKYGKPFRDSTVYTYDGQNRIVTEASYYFDYTTTNTYLPSGKTDYTYTDSNITKLNTVHYKIDSVNDYPFSIAYTYDTKDVNLLGKALGNEAIIIGMQQNFGPHNVNTLVGTYPQSPQFNRNTTYRYIYNTNYRPLRADVTDKVTGAKGTMVFTYQ